MTAAQIQQCQGNCRMLLDALKGAKRGNWEDADRLLALEALGGELASPLRLIGEFSTHVFGGAHLSVVAPAPCFVTRIEIEPGDRLGRREAWVQWCIRDNPMIVAERERMDRESRGLIVVGQRAQQHFARSKP